MVFSLISPMGTHYPVLRIRMLGIADGEITWALLELIRAVCPIQWIRARAMAEGPLHLQFNPFNEPKELKQC